MPVDGGQTDRLAPRPKHVVQGLGSEERVR
jgi:hypothetical protein